MSFELSIQDAAIAYDAWLEDRAGFDFATLVEAALTEYERRFPKHAPYRTFSTERCGGPDYTKHKMDVYCTFCRGLLVGRTPMAANPTAHARVTKHTTGCALACLAGIREMRSPDTRSLVDEDRAF